MPLDWRVSNLPLQGISSSCVLPSPCQKILPPSINRIRMTLRGIGLGIGDKYTLAYQSRMPITMRPRLLSLGTTLGKKYSGRQP